MKEYNVTVHKRTANESGEGQKVSQSFRTKYSLDDLLLLLVTDRHKPTSIGYDEIVIADISDNLDNVNILLRQDGNSVARLIATTQDNDNNQNDDNNQNNDRNQNQGNNQNANQSDIVGRGANMSKDRTDQQLSDEQKRRKSNAS